MSEKGYLDRARREISEWESTGPGYLAQVGDFILRPVEEAINKLAPEAIQDAVAKAIEAFLSGLSVASRALTSTDEVRLRAEAGQKGDKLNLQGLDEAAKHYWNWHIGYAAIEGGAAGAAGIVGLAADIPALFTIAIRLIQETATCYGYDVYDDSEHDYVLHVLRAGSTGDIKAKLEFLVGLKQIEQMLLKVAWKQMNKQLARKEISRLAALAALRQFAKSLGVQITKRKALQAIPVVGALVGASFNATFVNDVGRAAYMSYRRRWIQEHIDCPCGP
jgi:EcsC protein family